MSDFNRYANVIESMIRKYDPNLWQDLRQECALAYFELREREDLNMRDEFSYTVKTMYHAICDFVTREDINSHLSIDELAFEEEGDGVTFADLIEEPSVLINQIEARDFIEKWDIPEEDMRILRLYYVDGLSPRDMENEFDISYRTIYRIISKYS